MLIDGNPFFPLGVWSVDGKKSPAEKAAILARNGFNTARCDGDLMDDFASAGMMVLMKVPEKLPSFADPAHFARWDSMYRKRMEKYSGNVYDKFTVELRYPVILQPQSTIFALVFLEGGNCWSDIRDFNPFQIKRSAGVGVRVFLPVVGLLGVDWGWGFDDSVYGGSQFHFVIGQQF